MSDGRPRVAVTGASGYLGRTLISRLESSDSFEFVLATDIRPPTAQFSGKVTFLPHDVTEPFLGAFDEHRIDSIVHLAYVLNPGRRVEAARRVNVSGTDMVLDAALSAGARHILYLSSTSVYGAHRDNPEFLTEADPVRPIRGFQYSEDKAAVESRLAAFSRRFPGVTITVLRVCPVLGPNSDNFISNAFHKPILPTIAGADPEMQFLHEDDLVDFMMACLVRRPAGVFNLAGEGTIRWSRMAELMGSRTIRLPNFAWRGLTSLAWSLRLQSDSPACGLNFIRYPWTADTRKLKDALGFSPRYSSEATWTAYAETLRLRSESQK